MSADLGVAHRGYQYQDALTACLLAESLVVRTTAVVVDVMMVDKDRFDDVTIHRPGRTLRCQIKASDEGARALEYKDLTAAASRVNLGALVESYTRAVATGALHAEHEFRLCVTWNAPTSADSLRLIKVTDIPSCVPTWNGSVFKLKVDELWREGCHPIWKVPTKCTPPTRDQFLSFAEHFVLETDLPPITGNLREPGALEVILLKYLENRVGIGSYPNNDRRCEDVASRLIHISSDARARRLTISPEEIIHRISLRVDDGRITQSFPVNQECKVERSVFQESLRGEVERQGRVAIVGPPGSGKSWELRN